jgi:hypothetical protein
MPPPAAAAQPKKKAAEKRKADANSSASKRNKAVDLERLMSVMSLQCDHERGIYDFRELGSTCFTEKYAKKDNYPVKCCGDGCGKHFVKDRKKVFEGVANVRACPNAYNHRDHKCVYALCSPCWAKACKDRRAKGSPLKRKTRNSS